MSKFFNETANAEHREVAAVPPANLDIQQLLGSLKKNMESGGSALVHAAETGLKDLLKPLQETRGLASQLATRRLEKRIGICLPRTEKSFLVSHYNAPMQAAVEAYRILRTRLVKQQTAKGTRSLAVTSSTQGEGKTLTVFNLAVCYAKIQDWPVLAVDADLRTRGLSRLVGDLESPGLAAILEGTCEAAAAVLRTDVPDLYVLPAGTTKNSPAELFHGGNWREFMGWASETFRLVILDSPPALAVSDFELIMAHCESAMIIARARSTLSVALTQVLAQVDPSKLAGVVFNAAEETYNYRYRYHGGVPKGRNSTDKSGKNM